MTEISSDEQIYITQNVFSRSESRPNINVLDEIVFAEREIQQPDNELQPVLLLDREKNKRIIAFSHAELEKRIDDCIPEGTRHNTNWPVCTWKERAELRNLEGGRNNDLHGVVEQDILSLRKNSELSYSGMDSANFVRGFRAPQAREY